MLERFAAVFDLTYTRFLDLQKAEAQAREAKIEAALERVRARTMAMQRSDELAKTAYILFQQFKELGEDPDRIFIGIVNEAEGRIDFWTTEQGGNQINLMFKGNTEEPIVLQKVYTAWKEQKRSIIIDLTGKDLADYLHFLEEMGVPVNKDLLHDRRVQNVAIFSKGVLGFGTPSPRPPETIQLLERFAGVFDLTYTRFLDLKQAEAQAREAQIELALERVRARTMAMHHSNELANTASVLFQQIKELGFDMWSCGFCIWAKDDFVEAWMNADSGGVLPPMMIPYKEEPTHRKIYESSLQGDLVHEKVWEGAALAEHYKFLSSIPSVKQAIDLLENSGLSLPSRQCYYAGFFKQGYLLIITKEPKVNARDLSIRFARVFEQTYTRFNDLKQAEAQAKEAQIEAALERVRSRTLAMHKSDELAETAAVVFKQLIGLGIAPNRLYIGIIKDDSGDIELWATDEDGSKVNTRFTGNIYRNLSVRKMYEGWKEQKKSIAIDMQGKDLTDYIRYLTEELQAPVTIGHTQKRRVQSIAYFAKGFIGIASPDPQPEATITLLERFASVFNLTYTRFNDLQQAEAQTHKANIEVALERVRARALAMQQPEELVEVAEVLRQEMGLLGVEELETSSIYIHHEESGKTECWYALRDPNQSQRKISVRSYDHGSARYLGGQANVTVLCIR